ncbi:CIC11C00000000349 [Sungouiella intermedia]|uniref:CIC11C00000000349 n=1 Tax=Sungouiella intermedia TaxID=45354 RepID=A0A1L0BY08_9ASCO|nr:CIC11C00000004898 [[Candida] intermedia]SGZ55391.1 CIC11C00000000349 [[Candida] intermedia]
MVFSKKNDNSRVQGFARVPGTKAAENRDKAAQKKAQKRYPGQPKPRMKYEDVPPPYEPPPGYEEVLYDDKEASK